MRRRAGGPPQHDRAAPSARNKQHRDTAGASVRSAVVSNLPVVPQEKYEKLEGVVKKIFSSIGTIREGKQSLRAQRDGTTAVRRRTARGRGTSAPLCYSGAARAVPLHCAGLLFCLPQVASTCLRTPQARPRALPLSSLRPPRYAQHLSSRLPAAGRVLHSSVYRTSQDDLASQCQGERSFVEVAMHKELIRRCACGVDLGTQ